MSYDHLLSIIATLLGIIATVSGGIAWYSTIVRKRYASERDFAHIRTWQITTSQYLDSEMKSLNAKLDSLDDKLLEVKMMVYNKRFGSDKD